MLKQTLSLKTQKPLTFASNKEPGPKAIKSGSSIEPDHPVHLNLILPDSILLADQFHFLILISQNLVNISFKK